ncbi:hypothetical protein, partial [Microbulbifer aestuariivivens]|uniref:hypothetical protein n=1 Tax=Microbulbifer aestuariivivens TaxID=1908308 RepID=UPI0031EDD4AA
FPPGFSFLACIFSFSEGQLGHFLGSRLENCILPEMGYFSELPSVINSHFILTPLAGAAGAQRRLSSPATGWANLPSLVMADALQTSYWHFASHRLAGQRPILRGKKTVLPPPDY